MTWHYPAHAHAAAFPEKTAVRFDQEHHSWSSLLERCDQLQQAWASIADPGTTLVIPAHRSMRFVEHFVAMLQAGIHPVLLSPDASEDDQKHAMRLSQARIFVDEALLQKVESNANKSDHEGRLDAAPWNPERILLSVMTSGTTGTPKLIDLRAEQVVFSTLGGVSRLGCLPQDAWLAPLPVHHVGGIMVLLRALILGFEVVYSAGFDAAQCAEQLESGEIALASLVPVMLERILQHSPALRPSPVLRAILLGGAATPPSLLQKIEEQQLPVALSWGMSETSSQIATAAPAEIHSPLAPLPFARIFLEDDSLVIDGPQAMGGRHKSSDRGEIDARGVRILGRNDDVFISGGENIDPTEIERVLRMHKDVQDALVLGAPSKRWGQETLAFVVASNVDSTTLLQHCASALERLKIPKSVIFVDDLPRNAMGKPSRKVGLEIWNARKLNDASNGEDNT